MATTAPGDGAAVGGGALPDLHRRLAPLREAAAALQQRMAAGRERPARSDPALASTRALAEQTLLRQEQVKELKDQFRDLQSQLPQALSATLRKESKHKLTMESITSAEAVNERLKALLIDMSGRRDRRTAAISDQLQALEALEAKGNEDETWQEKIGEALSWFDKFLGFQVLAREGYHEGVKFVFNKIDPQSPEKEYSFCINIDNDRYDVLQCDPPIEEFDGLVKDLNLSDDLCKFVRIAREKFQTSSMNGIHHVKTVACPDVPSMSFSSPVMTSVNSRSEDISNHNFSQSKNKKPPLPAKRGATALSASSPGGLSSSVRRSSRIKETR